ncbi:MAG: molybdopterin molybdenumtransferase MoeA [Chloroflexi bacterium]|nr:molybdopterin molybdenumtransferase MoeA [Chloroflexota bacterium]
MPEFFNVLAPQAAFEAIEPMLRADVEVDVVPTSDALGRVTAEDVVSPEDLPAFARSTMDGYSVRSRDTFGASEGLPAYLDLVGEVPMGRATEVELGIGQAATAYTGGMLARGADAVVMVERTQVLDDTAIEVLRSVAPGENVVQVGEDVRKGEPILSRGSAIRAQDIGGMLALGITSVAVNRKPVVGIISTGDELVPTEEKVRPGQIRDINSYTIAALVEQSGGKPKRIALVSDEFEAQRQSAVEGLDTCDALVFSAGSSVSSRDLTADVLNSLGKPGVIVHGISIKPGKPTVVGAVSGKPVFGLPGNPVSAMVVFDLLVRPAIYHLSGCKTEPPQATARATLARDIPSVAGREDYVPVRLVHPIQGVTEAIPVFGKSNLIYTLVRSDGIVKVPLDKSGLYAGEAVDVRLF